MNRNFYSQLQPFRNFEHFTDDSHYCPVPGDWSVYVTDIVNSTQAIEQGKYKEVNLIGAASITLCINLLPDVAFPFVFGGDGASLCIPDSHTTKVDAELGSLIRLAQDNFGLELRVAKIPLQAIEAQGKKILVARFELFAGNTLAFFRGGGMALADQLAKSRYASYAVPAATSAVEELVGLSCRWSPIPASKSCIVSLLVLARSDDTQRVFGDLVREFSMVMGQSLDDANPVAPELVRYKGFLQALRDEYSYHRTVFSMGFLKRCIEIVLAVIIFRYAIKLPIKSFDRQQYMDKVRFHSDYRKFDDTLRLVLDCTDAQVEGLETVLQRTRAAGLIYYGLFRSPEALMTCFVQTMQDGGHLHFIDGGDGGLAMAARQLKAQVSAEAPRNA